MVYYYVYKITCTAGSFKDHYYIGQHKCHCLPEEDPYKGSGVMIKKYYQKYPHDYIKEILCLCKDADDLNQKEAEFIGDLYKTDQLCLNRRAGGGQPGMSDATRKKMSQARKGEKCCWYGKTGEKAPHYGKHHSQETCDRMSAANKGKKRGPMSGETKRKLSECHRGEKSRMYNINPDLHPNAKKVIINGKTFGSFKSAYDFFRPACCYSYFYRKYKNCAI